MKLFSFFSSAHEEAPFSIHFRGAREDAIEHCRQISVPKFVRKAALAAIAALPEDHDDYELHVSGNLAAGSFQLSVTSR